jgi:tRNA(Arg) A34 adenosine deaminase TadA
LCVNEANVIADLNIDIPAWFKEKAEAARSQINGIDSAMALAIEFSAENIRRDHGGPFGAVVIRADDHSLVAAGANLVTSRGLSSLHAEVVALSLAQRMLKTWDLHSAGELILVSSCEPCIMCMGATIWSGVTHLVCGARGSDAELAGFDEGPKPEQWEDQLRQRGIAVQVDVQRDAAAKVLANYASGGGKIYNARGQS